MPAPLIRPRHPEDLPACAKALYGVHEKDGYPVRWPADPQRWLTPDAILGAWVAADEATILGHVSLAQPSDTFAAAIDHPAPKLALVGRLFVAVDARRGGLASDLLSHAAQAARDEGRRAVLEVDANAAGAVAFYERAGWRFLRDDTGGWIAADGLPARVRIYLAPEA
ncbi:GNAT superfamily N-acetyltransferase [Catenulispora sp. EB89]|uniref:GNAT family N-acetyltransferase n=1 Tax=Catenulispora sp. EB89 TaxID=3156257 RepID=UPI0035144577